MWDNMAIYIALGAVVLAFFVTLWLVDARRTKRQQADPERTDVAPDDRRGRRRA